MQSIPRPWNGGLQVFDIDLDHFSRTSCGESVELLDDAERQRAHRMATPLLRARFVAAHCATRRILAQALGISAADIGFSFGRHGKPSMASPLDSGIHFNLSHCQGRALLALCDEEVGVDLEAWIERDTERLAGEVLDGDELSRFAACPRKDQPRDLAMRWAAKEALLKAAGVGLQLEPRTVPVDTRGGWHRLPATVDDSPWWLQRIDLAAPFCGYVATRRKVEAAQGTPTRV